MTDATMAEHHRRPLLKVIRAKCLDCCCGDRVEVKHCAVIHCDLHPYRMGKNPFFSRTPKDNPLTQEQKDQLTLRLQEGMRRKKSNAT